MIQVPVVVRDRNGSTVGSLEKEDFELFDNGKRVEIASFSVEKPGSQTIPDRSLPDPNAPAAKPASKADIPERFIAYFFDDRNIRGIADVSRIKEAVSKQLAALQPGDRAGVFTSSCYVMEDFTNDRAKLAAAVSHLQIGPPPMCRVSRAQVLQVEVLSKIVSRMSGLPGKRQLIVVSPGFLVGHDRSEEEATFIGAAVQAKVVIDVIDTGAVNADDAITTRPGTAATSDISSDRNSANPGRELVLADMTRSTGGIYITGNDYGSDFRRLATPESHYVLGFVPGKADGRLHQLKVKLAKGSKFKVESRTDYYATQQP